MFLSPEVSDTLPYFLKGASEITALLGRDGLVVIHRDAFNDSFEFFHNPEKTVSHILREQGIGELEKPEHEPPAPVRMSGPHWVMEWGERRPASKEFGWKSVEVVPKSGISERTKEAARDQAEVDVQTFTSARLMGLAQESTDETRDKVIVELEAAINEFERLLATDPDEPKLQMFLGLPRNKILLDPSAKAVTPEVKLGSEYRVDFVLELPQQRHVLVEIERPRDQLYTDEGDPARRHKHGQQQIMDWIEWLDENRDYARKNIPALSTVKEPEYRLVVGLRSNTSEKHQKALTRKNVELHRIETMTFDDMLDRAKQYLKNLHQLQP